MNTTSYTCQPSPVGSTAPKVVSAFVFILAVITCVGNAILCYGMVTTRRLRSNINSLVTCMSTTDLISSVLLQPLDAFYFLQYPVYPYPSNLTILWNAEFHALMTASVFFLTAVMAERLVAVRYALRYHALVTDTVVRVVIVGIWLYTLLTFVVVAAVQTAPPPGQYSFTIDDSFYLALYIVNIAIPIVLTSIMAVYLTRLAFVHRGSILKSAKIVPFSDEPLGSKPTNVNPKDNKCRGRKSTKVHPTVETILPPVKVTRSKTQGISRLKLVRSEIKSLRLAITMAACLILSWLPFFFSVANYRFEIFEYSCLVDFLALLVGWMTYWTSWVNLFIYVALNKDFRGIFKRFFRFDKTKPNNNLRIES